MLKLNCGLSYPEQSFEDELKKIDLAVKYRIDYLSVISIDKDRVNKLWEEVKKRSDKITVCSAPVYEMIMFDETPEQTITRQASYGVKAMTFHITPVGLLKEAKDNGYTINSRGGEFLLDKLEENPDYQNPFDLAQDLVRLVKYAMSCGVKEFFLGTALRPGACEPLSKWTEKELVIAARIYDEMIKNNIPVQIEGFGHVPEDQWSTYYDIIGSRAMSSMGPLLTDSVNGFDDINAIVGYTMARSYGFNITTECMLSRKEHIDMPDVEDVEDEIQKWRVAETCFGVAKKEIRALADEKKVIDKKLKQRTQCSAHVNIFGPMNISKTCRVCGDKCPLLRDKEQLEGNVEVENREVVGL